MASGLIGEGRMVEPSDILGYARVVLGAKGQLAGRKIVVSAGGTHEAIDPVRFIGNRSSGKQGFAIAQAAIDRGADVTLIVGASALPTPYGAKRIDVESAQEMCEAVLAACRDADALIMAAAVADFQAAHLAEHKIKKTKDTVEFDVHLTRTPDILQAVKEQKETIGKPQITIGFAAETQNLIDNALAKLHAKGLDLIVANDVAATGCRVRRRYQSGDVHRRGRRRGTAGPDEQGAGRRTRARSVDQVVGVRLPKCVANFGSHRMSTIQAAIDRSPLNFCQGEDS